MDYTEMGWRMSLTAGIFNVHFNKFENKSISILSAAIQEHIMKTVPKTTFWGSFGKVICFTFANPGKLHTSVYSSAVFIYKYIYIWNLHLH